MMQSNPAWSRETDALETTLLCSERSSMRYDKDMSYHHQKGVRYHSPNSSTGSQLESGPSFSRPPIHRRSFSAGSILSSQEYDETRLLSPNFQCKCSEQRQPPSLLSRAEPFFNVRKWVELQLENSGSVARDHLASERTFLSYIRTSLAIASSGVALVQFFAAASASSSHASWHRLHAYIRPLGASTVIVGLLVLFIGVTRYFTVQVALTKGVFPVARLATGFVAIMLGVLVTLTFGILLAGKLEPKLK